ncbi:MAG: hypothetical protein AB1393_08600 [Candidatus Edwardsbacteria bacterium]
MASFLLLFLLQVSAEIDTTKIPIYQLKPIIITARRIPEDFYKSLRTITAKPAR